MSNIDDDIPTGNMEYLGCSERMQSASVVYIDPDQLNYKTPTIDKIKLGPTTGYLKAWKSYKVTDPDRYMIRIEYSLLEKD